MLIYLHTQRAEARKKNKKKNVFSLFWLLCSPETQAQNTLKCIQHTDELPDASGKQEAH